MIMVVMMKMTMGQKFHNVSVTDGPPAKQIKKMNDSEKKFFSPHFEIFAQW